jgi:competence protein ComEC
MAHLRKFILAWITLLVAYVPARGQEPVMVAHYIDVGQGLSVLLEFPCGAVLVDTGGQDIEHVDYLSDYLRGFFARRADLKNTLNTLFITHPHIDHTRGIRAVTEVCRVRNYVDDGMVEGSGAPQVKWMRKNADSLGIKLREVDVDEITALPHKNGLTDDSIDDVKCPTCDPKIVILSGGRRTNPGWPKKVYDQKNNHSLVIRVDFGKSSFLFTGDLEKEGIEKVLEDYSGSTTILRASVYQIGHHGSDNGITRELAEAISPEVAVMGVGKWDFGLDPPKPLTTSAFGHPRRVVVDLFSELIPGFRASPLNTKVFDKPHKPLDYTVRKKIYATGWDGDVRVSAKLDGSLRITTKDDVPDKVPFARTFGRSKLDKAWTDELLPPHDSVLPDVSAAEYAPCPTQSWNCRPRRFLLRRR